MGTSRSQIPDRDSVITAVAKCHTSILRVRMPKENRLHQRVGLVGLYMLTKKNWPRSSKPGWEGCPDVDLLGKENIRS